MKDSHDKSRRTFVKTLGYAAPAIVTLKAIPAFASAGSGRSDADNRWHSNNQREGYGRHKNKKGGGHNRRRHNND